MALPKSRSYQMEAKMQEHTCTLTFSYPLMPVQSWLRPGTGSHRAPSWKSSSANVSIVFQQWGSQRVVLGCIHWFKFRSQVQALGTILYVYGNPHHRTRWELNCLTVRMLCCPSSVAQNWRAESISSVSPLAFHSPGSPWNGGIMLNVHFQVLSIFERFGFLATKFRSQI